MPRTYSVTFTTTERLLVSLDVTLADESETIEETVGHMLKEGILGDKGPGHPGHRWMIPGGQLARADWSPKPETAVVSAPAADPNGGPGGS